MPAFLKTFKFNNCTALNRYPVFYCYSSWSTSMPYKISFLPPGNLDGLQHCLFYQTLKHQIWRRELHIRKWDSVNFQCCHYWYQQNFFQVPYLTHNLYFSFNKRLLKMHSKLLKTEFSMCHQCLKTRSFVFQEDLPETCSLQWVHFSPPLDLISQR